MVPQELTMFKRQYVQITLKPLILAHKIADSYNFPSNASTFTSIIPNTLAHDSPCLVSSVAALQMAN